jgi:hypothetical protein
MAKMLTPAYLEIHPETRFPQHFESVTISQSSADLEYSEQDEGNEELAMIVTPTPLSLALNIST